MTPFVQDSDFTLLVGDVRECLRSLPDESVHCVVTSPPYWGLRAYLGDDHPDKPFELGLEPTPDLFVAAMVDVFREVRRVMRHDATLWLNLGDSYAAGGGFAPDAPSNQARLRGESVGALHGANGANYMARANGRKEAPAGLKPKDLVGVPWRIAFALQADGWYLRSDIIWSKPNPMPESVTDRPTKAHEYVFLLTKSAKYFFDQEAVREPHTPDGRTVTNVHKGNGSIQHRDGERWPNGGRNVRSVWEIATQPYPEAHFATFPEALPERCIKAGSSERGCCPECGAPWTREVERGDSDYARLKGNRDWRDLQASQDDRGASQGGRTGKNTLTANGTVPSLKAAAVTTTGWVPSCNHGLDPAPAVCLDPFMGSGTTALVARRLGRKSVGVELNPEYAALCARRLQQLSLLAEV